jgi:hypothetical protein
MAARLEGYRRFHVYTRGWSDIAYQVGIDQDGRVWDLRGIGRESAANGDQSVNLTYLACLFLLGPGELPSPALLAAFNDWRRTRVLVKYPTATRVVGHRDIRPTGTDCPGPLTEALIKSGRILSAPTPAPAPTPTPEDNMPDPKDLWNYDGIPAPKRTDVEHNPTWGAATYLANLGEWVLQCRDYLAAQGQAIEKLNGRLDALEPGGKLTGHATVDIDLGSGS